MQYFINTSIASTVIDDSSYRLNFDLDKKKAKSITTAGKSMVKLPSLAAKCCKMRKIWPYEICKFCINLYYARENAHALSVQMWCIFPRVIQINTKFSNFTRLYFPHFKHFAAKLCNFTNFTMLFLAVVMDFVLLA